LGLAGIGPRFAYGSLARIIHEVPTATTYLLDLVNDFSVRFLDVLGSQPAVPNAEIVHQVEQIRGRSRHFMNNPG